ncbi:MAG: acetyl-CoA hydrolase/transferase C-terminal domain-containing protein [Dehalococcoidia bacterium]|nr:acetyl-CoA hydrolase/transferase C-terminal domain-containing protein [Dehalococcoidia bacterium]
MEWQEDYKRKLVSADEAVRQIVPGDRVVFQDGPEPERLGHALAARRGQLRNVQVVVPCPIIDFGWYDGAAEGGFAVRALWDSPLLAQKGAAHRPKFRDAYARSLQVWGPPPGGNDVFVTRVAPPDEHGLCFLGHSVWDKTDRAAKARLVLAEVDPRLARTYGDSFLRVSDVHHFVEADAARPLPSAYACSEAVPEYARKIAGFLRELVEDGDTIQLGAGPTCAALPLAGAFEGKADLGVHTESLAGSLLRLAQQRVVTGERKTLHRHRIVAAEVVGTEADLAWAANNPIVELRSLGYVADPAVIAKHDHMLAINEATAIDLTGQIFASHGGTRNGPAWGAANFAVGALLARGGRSVFVMPAMRNGASSIVVNLDPLAEVTVTRTAADLVITEYGVASLIGKSQRERATELIALAHPDVREELTRQARKLFWP